MTENEYVRKQAIIDAIDSLTAALTDLKRAGMEDSELYLLVKDTIAMTQGCLYRIEDGENVLSVQV